MHSITSSGPSDLRPIRCIPGLHLGYEWFHFLHHLPPTSWLGRRSLVGRFRRHHELARMEKGNFSVSFPLWDWILETMLED